MLQFALVASSDEVCIALIESDSDLSDPLKLYMLALSAARNPDFDRRPVIDALRKAGLVFKPDVDSVDRIDASKWGHVDKRGTWVWTYNVAAKEAK